MKRRAKFNWPIAWQALACLSISSLLIFFSSCKPDEKSQKAKIFSGVVSDISEEAVADAEVEIRGKTVKTGARGEFTLKLAGEDTLGPFLLNIRKFGYGLFSRTYQGPLQDLKITMNRGTVKTFDSKEDIRIKDTRIASKCSQPPTTKIDFTKYKVTPKVYNNKGELIDFGFPTEFQQIIKLVQQNPQCNPGASVVIPGGSFVMDNNQVYNGKLEVSITTIDIYNGDGMPGDFTVQLPGNQLGYMETLGAVNIEVRTEKGEKLKLARERTAEVSVPIDPYILKTFKAPDSISFLHYNDRTGLWEQDGFGILNATKDAYVATTKHFSSMNMDLVKKNPSCMQLRQIGANYQPTYRVEVIVPPGPTWPFRNTNFPMIVESSLPKCVEISGANPTQLHPIFNLPNNASIGLVFKDNLGAVTDVAIVTTSPVTTLAAGKPPCPDIDCQLGNCAASPNCCTDPLTCACGFNQCLNVVLSNTVSTGLEVIAIPRAAGRVTIRWAYGGASAAHFGVRYCDGTTPNSNEANCESFCVANCNPACAASGVGSDPFCGACTCVLGTVFSTDIMGLTAGAKRFVVTAFDASFNPIGNAESSVVITVP